MDLGEIINTGKQVTEWVLLGGASYILADLFIASIGLTLKRKKINSKQEATALLEERAKKLSLNPSLIRIKLRKKERGDANRRFGGYDIEIGEGESVFTLDHELYHIYRGDTEKDRTFFRYHFVQEPRADLYALTGIRL